MDLHLQGRTALITGASAGLGRAIALALAAEGTALVLVGRRRALLESVAAEAVALGAPHTALIEADLQAEGATAEVARQALAACGTVDVLVNCMGASRQATLDTTDAEWDETLTLNSTRHRQLTTALLGPMRAQGWGRVINITGKNETTGLNATVVAKAAVHAWAKGLSDLVAAEGITVNCIAPGRLDSEQMRRLYTPERRDATATAEIPVGRFGRPEELACVAAFLASPRAGYITGAVIPVDGGARRYMY